MARYAIKPVTEVCLSELQEKYLTTRECKIETVEGDQRIVNYDKSPFYKEMFQKMVPYARSLILKQTKGKIFLPPDIVDAAAVDSTIKLMTQYNRPGFLIDRSFAGYLYFKIKETLYNDKLQKEDRVASLNSIIETKSNSIELGDLAETLNFTYMFRPGDDKTVEDPANYLFNKEHDAIRSALTVTQDVFATSSLKTAMKVVIGVLQFIRKSSTYKIYVNSLKEEEESILNLSLLELRNRLANVA